jgi:hypothetical protein
VLERTTRLLSEGLARTINRRTLLRRAGETTFLGMAALAAGHFTSGSASAHVKRDPAQPSTPSCAPPGPYCNLNGVNEPNGCHGASCFQHLNAGTVYQCRVYYQYYQAGCWTTAVTGGYWTCCDCECLNSSGSRVATCGCAQFSSGPAPRPDGPGGSRSS